MGKELFAVTPASLKDALVDNIPEVVRSTKCKLATHTLENNSTLFTEKGFLYADPDFLKIFSYHVVKLSRVNPAEMIRHQ